MAREQSTNMMDRPSWRERLWRATRMVSAWCDRPLIVLCLTGLLYGGFILQRVQQRYGGDVTGFIVAGEKFLDLEKLQRPLVVQGRDGYDGQFYYALALNPLPEIRTVRGVSIDAPAYRQQRILYPLLVWLLSLGGQPWLAAEMMVFVNWAALCWMGWLGAVYAQSLGRHALLGLAAPLFPGFLLSLTRNLTEIVETAFLCAALVAYARHRHGRAAIFLGLAVLAKETALLTVMAAGVCFALSVVVRTFQPRWRLIALPAALYAGWQACIYRMWGRFSVTPRIVALAVTTPMGPLERVLRIVASASPHAQRLLTIELLSLAALAAIVLLALFRSRAPLLIKVAWAFYLVLGMSLQHFYGGDWAFMRALSEFYVLGALILLAARGRWNVALVPLVLTGWVALALDVLKR
jgi:hypothetical protein